MLAKLFRRTTRLLTISSTKGVRVQCIRVTNIKCSRRFSATTKDTGNSDASTTNESSEHSVPARTFLAKENATIVERENWVESMTPKKIVEKLDRYIIGQNKAKRAVAVSLRNRWRRQQLNDDMKKEVMPMNILMMGPTGTGKTEIARRLAQMVDAPFIKCEATKYTEVGIVGQSAEESVKDLVDKAIKMERERKIDALKQEIDEKVEHHILSRIPGSTADLDGFRKRLREGEFDNTKIEVASFRVEQSSSPFFGMGGRGGKGAQILNLSSFMHAPKAPLSDYDKKRDRVPVSEAKEIIRNYELQKSLDQEEIRRNGLRRAEESGIIFLDELDKLCSDHSVARGSYGGVKGEGVQKELLGLIEGTAVSTDYGIVHTDHMLFIAAGAFHQSNPSDLLPELQGRLPIRVELEALSEHDFVRILTETEANLVQQQQALFGAEDVDLEFTQDAIEEIAKMSKTLNESVDNIGARRLRAVISKLVEQVSYDAPDMKGQKIIVDKEFVDKELADIVKSEDLSKYIL
eukprot:CAMPEP_0202686872 /NCGR_PEP_ID=MMETSP1385-20130828/2632_1 /ASSEMBLY_ACC=CAM_ASM_000861 /TAXON_ID=933848 /ORGANISM="Elphidium margaritaceum" /LENGTH=519 /DNA_ID=CAMNT_0049341541 /DNA_START=39 /DNA_END=1598 /DNA_ORIENTATION=+